MRKKSVLMRFLRYFALYKGSIILAMGCTLVASICELVPIQILADTLDALKELEGYNQSRSVSIRFFEINDYFEGFEITLTNAGDALRFFLWILGGCAQYCVCPRVFRLWQRFSDGTCWQ